jgi:hypothetical protein
MIKNFTALLFFILAFGLIESTNAQAIITQWNFNSVPPDASNSTGSVNSSVGAGSIANIGGTCATFASGSANGGSSDPATIDNTGWGLTGWPAQGTGNKTAGIMFSASTVGHENITVSFDLRHSNTGPRHIQFQYTANISAANPAWIDFALDTATGADTWFTRSYNLSAISALNNNPNAGFRVVAAFDPSGNGYVASTSTSDYATTGTWRFDMITIKGTSIGGDVNPPVAQSYQVTTATTSFIKFNEAVTPATATNVANYSFSPSLTITNTSLSASGDTLFLTHSPLMNGQPYNLTVSGVKDLAANTMATKSFNVVFNASVPNLVLQKSFIHLMI